MWRDEEIRGGRVNKPSFAALSATVLIHVDKSKLARSAATTSIFSCPALTLILMISVFRSSAAFLGVFFIDGTPFPRSQCVATLCPTNNPLKTRECESRDFLNTFNPVGRIEIVNRRHCNHTDSEIS